MNSGEKKSSDLSNRLKRPAKLSRSSKTTSPSSIVAPPKAAIAEEKAKKEGLQRRKNPFNEMLHSRSKKEKDTSNSNSNSIPPRSEEHEYKPEKEQSRKTSNVSIEDIQDAKAADKIAELERALAVATEAQDAMRQELEKVRQHGVVTRETVDDYRRQLSGTYNTSSRPSSTHTNSPGRQSNHMEYDHPISPRRSVDKSRDDLIEQNYLLRGQLAELKEQLDFHEPPSFQHPPSRGDLEWNELTVRLHNTEKESQERLNQLLSLKHSISSLTRTATQVTDAELAERLQQLAYQIREWVISNFRRTKLDFSAISPDTEKALVAISLRYRDIDPTDRLALYQALISNTLMRIFNEPFIIGLPGTGPLAPIRQLAAYIHNTGSDYREWRRNTIRSLEKSEARHQLQVERDNLLHRMTAEISHCLFTLTSANLSPSARSSLLGILNTAADLQHTLLLQKAQYEIRFFRNASGEREVDFDADRMEVVNDVDGTDEDGDVFTERRFAFCVFPCLEKWGDEWGEREGVRNVLLRARVCVGVG